MGENPSRYQRQREFLTMTMQTQHAYRLVIARQRRRHPKFAAAAMPIQKTTPAIVAVL
jgi:hypothetical protein